MKWFEYDIVVPFGDTRYDVNLYAPHDLDCGAPPNHPIEAILAGSVSSITSPLWGKQVGVKLDKPVNDVPYCAYLHLSAVNPQLRIGSRIEIGTLIGWCGGGNTEADYKGTKNPTGQNFLNDRVNSSRIQVGFALMRGPEYGGAGWQNFPPIDWNLNPTQIILDARKNLTTIGDDEDMIPVNSPLLNGHAKQLNAGNDDTWVFDNGVKMGGAILKCARSTGFACGLALTNEHDNGKGGKWVRCERAILNWDPKKAFDNPPMQWFDVYYIKLDSPLAKDLLHIGTDIPEDKKTSLIAAMNEVMDWLK